MSEVCSGPSNRRVTTFDVTFEVFFHARAAKKVIFFGVLTDGEFEVFVDFEHGQKEFFSQTDKKIRGSRLCIFGSFLLQKKATEERSDVVDRILFIFSRSRHLHRRRWIYYNYKRFIDALSSLL